MCWTQENWGRLLWLEYEVPPDWRADFPCVRQHLGFQPGRTSRTRGTSDFIPLGMRTAKNKAVTGDQRTGTEGGHRGGPLLRDSRSEEINAATLNSSIMSAILYRKHKDAVKEMQGFSQNTGISTSWGKTFWQNIISLGEFAQRLGLPQ